MKKIRRKKVRLTDEQREHYAELANKAENDPSVPAKAKAMKERKRARQEEFADVMASLKRTRENAGVSLSEMAERAGISKSNLSLLENGKGNPTLATVKRIANALGATIQITVEA